MVPNSITVMLGKSATMALGFVFWVLAARQFSPEAVGLAAGAVAAMMLCTQLALLGVGSALISELPRRLAAPARLLDTSFTVVAVAGLLTGAVFLLLASGALPELGVVASSPWFTALFLSMTVLGTLGIAFDQVSIVLRRGDQMLVRGALFGVVTVVLIMIVPSTTGATSSLAIFAPWVVAAAVVCAIAVVQVRRRLGAYRYRPRLERAETVTLVRVGLPNWLLTLTERAPGLVLPILVTELLSPADNATWYAVWMMAWVVYVIPISVGLALFAEASHSPEAIGSAISQAIRTSLGIGLVAAASLGALAPLALSLLGAQYADDGVLPLRILVVGFVPLALVQAYFAVCRARRTLPEAIATGVASGVVAVVAAIAAGVAYGLVGMALAWLGAQVLTGAWAVVRLRSASRDGRRASSLEGPAPRRETVAQV